jgi:hypothetical protein
MSAYKFELTPEQIKKYEEWRKTLPKRYEGAIGGATQFIFTPTGVGDGVKVKYFEYELDLTEYDNW